MKLMKSLFVLALAVFVAAPAYAETQNVKVSGSLDVMWFYRENFDLRDNNDAGVIPVGTAVPGASHAGSAINRSEAEDFFTSITQVEISADLTDNVSAVINLINQRDWNADDFGGSSPTVSADNTTEEFDVGIDLAYMQMKEIFYSPLTLTIGRQDLFFGRGFIVGWNPQDNNGTLQADEFTQEQAFDAFRATLDFDPWTIDFVYSKIIENSHNAEDDSDLWIIYVTYLFSEYNAVADLYWVGQNDRAAVSGSAGTHNNDTHTFGGRIQFDPIEQITLGAEIAYQTGNYRGLTASPERDRESWGVDLFAEYRWDYEWNPMLGIQFVSLGGEDDLSPGATSEYNAWNGAFRSPTYGWIHDYKEVYFATASASDQIAGQNIEHISVYGSLAPLEDLLLTGAFYYFWYEETAHAVTTDPGSGSLSDEIGWEIDLSVVYNYTEDVTFWWMGNWFEPGDSYSSPVDEGAFENVVGVSLTF